MCSVSSRPGHGGEYSEPAWWWPAAALSAARLPFMSHDRMPSKTDDERGWPQQDASDGSAHSGGSRQPGIPGHRHGQAWLAPIAFSFTILGPLAPWAMQAGSGRNRARKPAGRSGSPGAARRPPLAAAKVIELARLPEAGISEQIANAPRDETDTAGTAGMIAHNREPVHVHAAAGGPAIAWMQPQVLSSDVWLPVIGQQPGWVRVLLPSGPNGATGWLATTGLDVTHTPHEVRVHRRSGRLQLFTSGRLAGTWPVAAGTTSTPTPAGRTFLLAAVHESGLGAASLTLALGCHSTAEPGRRHAAVAIHPRVAASDIGPCGACLRAPADALDALAHIPAGSLVRIYR